MGSNPISSNKMFLNIVLWPLYSIVFLLCFNRSLGNKGTALISTFYLGFNTIVIFFCFIELAYNNSFITVKLLNWFSLLGIKLFWSFYFDNLNLTILLMIFSVSLLIHLYAIEYFSNDPRQARFMLYLTCFTASMAFLVASENLIQIFFAWELIGLFSYLLINFWFTWLEANKSSIKAMIVNRVGDFFLTIFFFILFDSYKTMDLNLICGLSLELNNLFCHFRKLSISLTEILAIFLFFGIAAKSAQIPFRTWLVNAMSAPSPVSALIRAATLVTSGIFLIIKFSFFLEFSYSIIVLSFLGLFTALFAGLTALVQNDSKRIVAYSTCSQLGYMSFACGISQYNTSFFRLINHGCFKALLFLGVGSLIRSVENKQDLRTLGNLTSSLPANYSMFLIGSLTLAGTPFLSGFYSKDLIIEVSFVDYSFSGLSIYFLSIFVAILTTIYSARLIYYVYLRRSNMNEYLNQKRNDAGYFIILSLIILTTLSIFNGYLLSDLFVGIGSDFFDNAIFFKSEHYGLLNAEFEGVFVKNLPFISSTITIVITIISLNNLRYKILTKGSKLYHFYNFLSNRWFFDYVQNRVSLKFFCISHNLTFKLIDKGFLETLGPESVQNLFKQIVFKITFYQSGFLYRYLLIITLSWFFFLILFLNNIKLKKLIILFLYIL